MSQPQNPSVNQNPTGGSDSVTPASTNINQNPSSGVPNAPLTTGSTDGTIGGNSPVETTETAPGITEDTPGGD